MKVYIICLVLAAFHLHDTLQAASGRSETFDEEDGLDIEIKPRLGLDSFQNPFESFNKAKEIFDKIHEVFHGSTATPTPTTATTSDEGVTDPKDPDYPEEPATKDPKDKGDEHE